MKMQRRRVLAWVAGGCIALPSVSAAASVCHGSAAQGRLDGGVRLPVSGPNFSAYSTLGAVIGRTHVHDKVAAIVLQAYDALARSLPGRMFVYGESGWADGGRLWPHRTHRNGLSVDFMVPVRTRDGRAAQLPAWAGNGYGYGLDFDARGHRGPLEIDLLAVAEHLYQLDQAARAHGVGLARVIFDTDYLPRLWATPRGAYLQRQLQFLRSRPWVRHDDHYHVDFALPCRRS